MILMMFEIDNCVPDIIKLQVWSQVFWDGFKQYHSFTKIKRSNNRNNWSINVHGLVDWKC